jgi:hypothetical protein
VLVVRTHHPEPFLEIVMKVYIGPYKNYVGPYQVAEKIFFWLDHRTISLDDDHPYQKRWDYRACEKLGDWLADSWVDSFCSWIQKKRGDQKINIRIDNYDTWSMDHTLALIVHPMLVQLRDTNHGFFLTDPEDVPHIGKGEETDHGYNDTLTQDRYNWVMDELVWTFERLKDNNDYELFYTEENGWDFPARDAHYARINNGLRLFGKYYRALWD